MCKDSKITAMEHSQALIIAMRDELLSPMSQIGDKCGVVAEGFGQATVKVLKDLKIALEEDEFKKHLARASKEVASWPQWKREVLGSKDTPPKRGIPYSMTEVKEVLENHTMDPHHRALMEWLVDEAENDMTDKLEEIVTFAYDNPGRGYTCGKKIEALLKHRRKT